MTFCDFVAGRDGGKGGDGAEGQAGRAGRAVRRHGRLHEVRHRVQRGQRGALQRGAQPPLGRLQGAARSQLFNSEQTISVRVNHQLADLGWVDLG